MPKTAQSKHTDEDVCVGGQFIKVPRKLNDNVATGKTGEDQGKVYEKYYDEMLGKAPAGDVEDKPVDLQRMIDRTVERAMSKFAVEIKGFITEAIKAAPSGAPITSEANAEIPTIAATTTGAKSNAEKATPKAKPPGQQKGPQGK